MKFEIERRKTSYNTEEVEVTLPEESKRKLRIAALVAFFAVPLTYLIGSGLTNKPEPKLETEPQEDAPEE